MAMNAETGTYELFADTGANVHISPCRDDFTTFTPIPPRAIKGFQGSSINALGIGTIITDKLTQELALCLSISSPFSVSARLTNIHSTSIINPPGSRTRQPM
jgi:hypothetical protein